MPAYVVSDVHFAHFHADQNAAPFVDQRAADNFYYRPHQKQMLKSIHTFLERFLPEDAIITRPVAKTYADLPDAAKGPALTIHDIIIGDTAMSRSKRKGRK